MIDPNKTYAVKSPNSVGIFSVSLQEGSSVIKDLEQNKYLAGTKIFELGTEYKVVLNSSVVENA